VPTIGAKPIDKDETMGNARRLGAAMKPHWKFKPSKGFFLRAEDFFSFVKQVASSRAEMEAEIHRVDKEYVGHSKTAQDLAKSPFTSSLADMTRRYGADLDANSHGESFLKVFQARFVPNGLYLLDEPETPLSPTRQLAFIAMMRDMIKQGCQFVIATHSPIIMAYPGARILDFDVVPPKQVPYDELEHVRILKAFLDNPETFLRRLDTDLDD
jgi:predicted ATPase